jgi:hypothetical protein
MFWLELTIGIVIGGLILLLVTPIKIKAVWAPEERAIVIRYLGFGRTTDFAAGVNVIDWLGLRLFRSEIGAKRPTKKKPTAKVKKEKAKAKKEKAKIPLTRIIGALATHRQTVRRVLARALVLVGRLLLCPRLRLLRLDVAAGSGNPAVTGMYYGWFNAVRPAWAANRVMVDWQPVFDRAHFAARFDGRVWLQPWRPVRQIVRFIIEIPKWKLYRLYKDIKKKEG